MHSYQCLRMLRVKPRASIVFQLSGFRSSSDSQISALTSFFVQSLDIISIVLTFPWAQWLLPITYPPSFNRPPHPANGKTLAFRVRAWKGSMNHHKKSPSHSHLPAAARASPYILAPRHSSNNVHSMCNPA